MGLLIGIGDTRPQMPYDYYYGIEWDITVSNPTPTRIGKMELHASLPVQSLMRRCVLRDDGTVAYYLHPNDSTKRDNSAPANLDGTDGQVMVEIPTFYAKFEAEGNKRRALISSHELPGFHKWSKCYASAYEATVQRSTNKLSSVMNATADYRGGNNDASKDGKFSSQLGRPATDIGIDVFRRYARNRGSSSWNAHAYQVQKALFWLFTIEYCTFNCQAPFTPSPDEYGRKRGGLGDGVTNLSNWALFGSFPTVPCGVTNSLGNRSGFVDYVCAKSDNGSYPAQTLRPISYRGVENPYGHIGALIDGAKLIVQSARDGGLTKLYVCDDKEKWDFYKMDGYELRGTVSRKSGFIKEIILGQFGEILPLSAGASSTTYFCDNFFTAIFNTTETRVLYAAGESESGANVGFLCEYANLANASRAPHIGTRLCYIP